MNGRVTALACQRQLTLSELDLQAVTECLEAFDHRDVLDARYAAMAVGTAMLGPARLLAAGFGWD